MERFCILHETKVNHKNKIQPQKTIDLHARILFDSAVSFPYCRQATCLSSTPVEYLYTLLKSSAIRIIVTVPLTVSITTSKKAVLHLQLQKEGSGLMSPPQTTQALFDIWRKNWSIKNDIYVDSSHAFV
ncbi:uncharacterized protein MCYG_03512 [Microsporum canis CBS 113480]|uniref:Uncharacterized protein n=1 Tax=Arthroderma otae (strain ATCC MYA-4605 / CBS 113480) TaxID=554155 RepID=C5FLX1_ARTOC|nr:uncharacterized protein MCYG_03512 [Microsporum canis CBS 113480]EEQ30693.1 predicted protein [Microsporum canis CBS 113480]